MIPTVFLLILVLFLSNAKDFRFYQISDTHVGFESSNRRLKRVVSEINRDIETNYPDSRKGSYNPLPFVFVTGDITESGLFEELMEAKSILDELEVPFFPIIGNHEIYDHGVDERYSPSGEFRFQEVFHDVFQNELVSYYTGTIGIRNSFVHTKSYFQNFRVVYEDTMFLALDFCSRSPELTDQEKVRSVSCGVAYNFTGGTLEWLRKMLDPEFIPSNISRIILVQHHRFWSSFHGCSTNGFAFEGSLKYFFKTEVQQSVLDKIVGVFSGHEHVSLHGQVSLGFTDAPSSKVFEEVCHAVKITPYFNSVDVREDGILIQNHKLDFDWIPLALGVSILCVCLGLILSCSCFGVCCLFSVSLYSFGSKYSKEKRENRGKKIQIHPVSVLKNTNQV